MEGVKMLSTNKGSRLICFNDHMYTEKHVGKKTITWRCSKRSSTKCLGYLKTALDLTNPIELGSHCHGSSKGAVSVKESYQEMKLRAQTSLDKPNQVQKQ